jgi:hypothetical protein
MVNSRVGYLYYSIVIQFIPKPISFSSRYPSSFSFLKNWVWIWLFMFGMCPAGTQAYQTGKWEKLEIFSKSFNEQDSLSLDLTAEDWKMVSALDQLPFPNAIHKIYKNQGSYFLMNDCELAIYTWKEGKWELYAGKDISGASCGAKLFLRGEEFYVHASFGYWQNHGDLFHFRKSGDVDYVKTINQPEDFLGNLNFTTSDGYYSFFLQKLNLRKGIKDFIWIGFFLDFTEWTWKEVEFELNENFEKVLGRKSFDKSLEISVSFETADYAFIEFKNTETLQVGLFIVDKKTSHLFILPFIANQFGDVKRWVQQDGNQLRFSTFFKTSPSEFQIDELVQSALPLGKISLKKTSSLPDGLAEYGLGIAGFVLVLTILAVFWILLNRKQKPDFLEPSQELNPEIPPSLSRLSKYSGQVISQEIMDELLEIQEQKNPDIRKVNRSRGIRLINDWHEKSFGTSLITRVKDTTDRRVIWYQVGKLKQSKRTTAASEPLAKEFL